MAENICNRTIDIEEKRNSFKRQAQAFCAEERSRIEAELDRIGCSNIGRNDFNGMINKAGFLEKLIQLAEKVFRCGSAELRSRVRDILSGDLSDAFVVSINRDIQSYRITNNLVCISEKVIDITADELMSSRTIGMIVGKAEFGSALMKHCFIDSHGIKDAYHSRIKRRVLGYLQNIHADFLKTVMNSYALSLIDVFLEEARQVQSTRHTA